MNYSLSHTTAGALVCLVAVALATAPLFAHAQLKPRDHICNNLDTVKERTMERVQTRAQNHTGRTGDQSERWNERKAERLAHLEAKRTNVDTARTGSYERLRSLAQTGAQEEAVESFVSTVDNAVATRRTAVDEAITTFEATSQALWDERDTAHTSFANNFEADVETLFDTAAAACEDTGVADDTLKSLRTDMEALRAEYKTQAENFDYREQSRAAHEALRIATEAAWETFRTDLADAKATLRTAFDA